MIEESELKLEKDWRISGEARTPSRDEREPMTAAIAVRTEEDTLHWLALSLTVGLGPRKARDLLTRFGSPQAIFRASASELESFGLHSGTARNLASGVAFEEAAAQHERLKQSGATLIPMDDPLYPEQLREIYDPPITLFVKGRVELLETVMVAIIGSRRATAYGKAVSQKLAAELCAAGVTVTSGMARGIDTAAHEASLQAKGGTIAVFGCGLDLIYPTENRKLAARIALDGLLLSEYPFGSPAYPQNFPVRNRIISGLSAGVVVVEGAQYSGSSITARLALDQGREVFAVPGNITSGMSYGPNLLIRQGAHLVIQTSDILDELPEQARLQLAASRKDKIQDEPAQQELSYGEAPAATKELAKQVVKQLRPDTPTALDDLLDALPGASASETIAVLFDLELMGLVKQLPGKSYILVW
jgi:DNA processing protein